MVEVFRRCKDKEEVIFLWEETFRVLSEWLKACISIVFVNAEDENHLHLNCNNLPLAERR